MDGTPREDKRLTWTTTDGIIMSVRPLKGTELPDVYALSDDQFAGSMAPLGIARAVLEHNSDAIWGVYRAEGAGEKLVGFVSFLMLNEAGAKRLRDDALDALHPDLAFLTPTGVRPALIYVWLIVARGNAAVAVPLVTQGMGSLYAGLPLCGRASTEAGARGFRNFGYRPVHPDRPDVGNLFWLDRSPSTAVTVVSAPKVRVAVTHSALELEHARAVRAIVFMGEQTCPLAEEFDGNDYGATHFIGYVSDEPAGTLRLRYFGTFVKIERLSVIDRFRKLAVADELIRTSLEFSRRKGYRKAYGHPQVRLIPLWAKYGFRCIEGIEEFTFSDHRYRAVVADLEPHEAEITIDSDPYIIVRPEGAWDEPGILERSAARPPTNPHAEGS